MLTQKQIKDRLRGVFGTDAGAIEGSSPYLDQVTLWAIKTGRVSEFTEQNNAMLAGHVWEPHLRNVVYPMLTGDRVRAHHKTIWHKKYKQLGAHIDGRVIGKRKGAEFKTAGLHTEQNWGPSGSDIVPPWYISQIKHYGMVLDIYNWDILCWFKHLDEARLYHFMFTKQDFEELLEKELQFWRYVESDQIPPFNESWSCLKTVQSMHYPSVSGVRKELDDAGKSLMVELAQIKQTIKAEESRLNLCKSNIFEWIGEAEIVTDADDEIVMTAKQQANNTRPIKITRKFNGEQTNVVVEKC